MAPLSSSRGPCWALVLTLALGSQLASCGASETPDPAGKDQPPGGAATDQLRLASDPTLPGWAEDNLRRRDPALDQWPSEVLHDRAKKVLSAYLKLVSGQEPWEDERLAAVLAPSFRGLTELRPSELRQVFDDGTAQVFRPAAEEDLELLPPAQQREIVRRLCAPYADGRCNTFMKIVRVELEGNDRFRTKALVHTDGKAQEGGGLLQQNMDWEIDWVVLPGDEEVRIEAVHVEHFDELRLTHTLFAELEQYVLGGNPAFEEELLHGVGDYYGRTDQLLGSPYLGMQGIALGDLDGDGLDDLYLAQHGGLPNRVFLHQPDGTAVDATLRSRAGVLENTRGVLILDWDNDGDQDLLLAVGAGLVSARNDGHGVFEDFQLWRAPGPGDIYSLAAADPDADGDLDVYACRYVEGGVMFGVPVPYHDADNGNSNVYFRNDEGRFVDATDEVGFGSNNHKFSLAAIWEDFDEDGDLDLFVSNDFGRDNLFRNEGGHFTDVAGEMGADDISAGMGVSVCDADLDGDQDLYITNMFSSAGQRIVPQQEFMGGQNPEIHGQYDRHARGNTLLANRGDGHFDDVTDHAGVAVGGWGWGAKFVDFNNDGLEDIFSPDGFLTNQVAEDL